MVLRGAMHCADMLSKALPVSSTLRGAMHCADVLSKALPVSSARDTYALYFLFSKLDPALSVFTSFLEVCSVWKAFQLHSF